MKIIKSLIGEKVEINKVAFVLPSWIEDFPEELIGKHREFGFQENEWHEHFLMTSDSEDSFLISKETMIWLNACIHAEEYFLDLIDCGWSAQKARSVLPEASNG